MTTYLAGTLVLASVYSDNSGTPKSNPATSDANGLWFGYLDSGRYDFKFSGGGLPSPWTLGDQLVFDFAASTAGTYMPCSWLSLSCTSGAVIFSNGTNLTGDATHFNWNSGTNTLAATNFSASGNGTVGGTLGVTGATTLASTLGVSGATTLSSSLTVLGNILTNGFITQYGGTPLVNQFMVWDGTKFVTRAIIAGDLPAGTTPVFKVNGSNTTSQTTINFQSGTGVVVSNPSAGNISFSSMGGKLLAHPTPTTSAPTTTSATPAVLAEMTAAVTVDSGISGVLLLFNAVVRETNVNDSTSFQFFKDGVAIGPITYMSSPIGSQNMGASLTFVDVPTAGAHTYDVRWANSAGGNTSTSDLTNRSFEVLELN